MELLERDPELYKKWQVNGKVRAPDGESMKDAMSRVEFFIDHIRIHHKGENVLAVGHGAIFQALICKVLELKPKWWWPFHLYIWFDYGNSASTERRNTCLS